MSQARHYKGQAFCALVQRYYDECKGKNTEYCRDVIRTALLTQCIAPKPEQSSS